jgi:hypothetical protein
MQRINYKNRNITTSILVMILLLSAFSLLVNMQALAQYKRGTLAPDFTMEALDGEIYQLSNLIISRTIYCFVL